MSYTSIADLFQDQDIRLRLIACATKEEKPNPIAWVDERLLQFAAKPGWGEAYEYALNTGVNRPGRDPGVITDAAILAAVQPME